MRNYTELQNNNIVHEIDKMIDDEISKVHPLLMIDTSIKPVEKLDIDLSKLTTMSAKIRYLHALGWKTGPISKKLNIRYQWARNVIITPLKKQ